MKVNITKVKQMLLDLLE